MDIKEIRKRLEEKKDYLKEEFHVIEIGIFGSFVRGEQISTSDAVKNNDNEEIRKRLFYWS
jgi:predicted nucleotidyltransferase